MGGGEVSGISISLWVSCEHVLKLGITMGSFFFTILASVWVPMFCLVGTPLPISRGRTPPRSPVDSPPQMPVARSFDFLIDLRLNKWFSKQSRRRWFELPSCLLWRHCDVMGDIHKMYIVGWQCQTHTHTHMHIDEIHRHMLYSWNPTQPKSKGWPRKTKGLGSRLDQ